MNDECSGWPEAYPEATVRLPRSPQATQRLFPGTGLGDCRLFCAFGTGRPRAHGTPFSGAWSLTIHVPAG